jgi:antirestriction protein ArdC
LSEAITIRVEEIITDRIIKLLEAGTAPWHKPWSVRGVAPTNAISKQEYHGINVLMLASAGYQSPYWLTFNQAKAAKGTVRKGEHGSIVVFAKRASKEIETDSGETEKRSYSVLRYYSVFNLEQTEGCSLTLPEAPTLNQTSGSNAVRRFMPACQTGRHCGQIRPIANFKPITAKPSIT